MNPTFYSSSVSDEFIQLQRRMRGLADARQALALLDRMGSAEAVKLFARASRMQLQLLIIQIASAAIALLGVMFAVLWTTNTLFDGAALFGSVVGIAGTITAIHQQIRRQPVQQLYHYLTPLTKEKEADLLELASHFKSCHKRLVASRSRRSVMLELDWHLVQEAVPTSAKSPEDI